MIMEVKREYFDEEAHQIITKSSKLIFQREGNYSHKKMRNNENNEKNMQAKDNLLKLNENQQIDKEKQIKDLLNQLIDRDNKMRIKEKKLKHVKNRNKRLTNQMTELSNQLIDTNNQIIMKDDQIMEKDIQIYKLKNQFKKYYYSDKYSEEEKEKRNKMIFSNQLIQNKNLLSQFGSKGTDPFAHFNRPYNISYNDKLNIIAVPDWGNKRVKIMDKKGALIRCFPFQRPRGIAIIFSLSLLAVSSNGNHVIEIFDISPLLPTIHNNNTDRPSHANNYWEEGLPLLYTIGKGFGGREDHFHFNGPDGIGYSEGKGILAISDFHNQRIEIYKIKKDGYEHHSFISLPFNPCQIAISSPGDLILVSDQRKVMIYKEEEEEGKKRGWREEGEMRSPPSLYPPLRSPRGIAIHSPLNYCVICDAYNNRILFFNLTTRDLICSYQPTLPSNPSYYYIQKPYGISIDEEADLISVSDIRSHSIFLFLSPIF